jgi:NADPH:quinone reductase-like Zn-dependent oxidoreductase
VSNDGLVKHLAVGDRVAGFVHGGRFPDRGSFADYIVTEGTQVWKVPQGTTDEEAAALGGIGPHTAVQALYMRHGLEQPQNPSKDGKPFLVWGGATSVGLCKLTSSLSYTVKSLPLTLCCLNILRRYTIGKIVWI